MSIFGKKIKLVTHDGSFHADDVFATASLSILLEKRKQRFELIRTRNAEIINAGDFVFDVGGVYDEARNRFDHHQNGFAEKRENGITYSSFGLIWKKFGIEICGRDKVADFLDKKLVAPVDAGDNGIDLISSNHEVMPYLLHNFFYAMHPTWKETTNDDLVFKKCVELAKTVLLREIKQSEDALSAEESIKNIYNNALDKRIIALDDNYPFEYFLHNFPEPLFAIYPRKTDGSWGVKAIREDMKTFKNRKDFPSTWGGLEKEELQKVSGVDDAIFCHRGLFLASAQSQAGAIKLAQIAVES